MGDSKHRRRTHSQARQPDPFLTVACFCESTHQDPTGEWSINRIHDSVTLVATAPLGVDVLDVAKNPPVLNAPLRMFIMGEGFLPPKQGNMVLISREPNGGSNASRLDLPFTSRGRFGGVILNVEVTLRVQVPGVYWFEVQYKDRVLATARMEVRIDYRTQDAAAAEGGNADFQA